MKPEIIRTPAFADDVAHFIAGCARQAVDDYGHFRLGLSGGNTPRPVYAALALLDCDWSKWIITFGDERCVPPDHPQSNYRMASEAFLLVTTPGDVLRIKGEIPLEEAALEYETALQHIAARFGDDDGRYRHDLILLGLGDDGHTASLFPQTKALFETKRSIVTNFVPKFDAYRITATYPLINAARRVAFLVNDPSKDRIIDGVLRGDDAYPASGVRPTEGELLWFIGQ
ncbi:MAG: 6-phosphogluconolactonase [Verrucomicrobia bacterium]|nr:6-phosphogluconolactonase [Verrucomicrobiota bacterium]